MRGTPWEGHHSLTGIGRTFRTHTEKPQTLSRFEPELFINITVRIHTKQSIIRNVLESSSQVAARLEVSSIGVYVHMANRLFDTNAEAQGSS